VAARRLDRHHRAPHAQYLVNAYSWGAGQSKQVVYGTNDGHVHELSVIEGGAWQHADLTAITGAPPAQVGLKLIGEGYSWEAGKSKQLVYRTNDGHIHELSVVKGGTWQHADLTAITGAPTLPHWGRFFDWGYAWEAGQSKQILFGSPGPGGRIYELYMIKGGAWQYADLTAITGAPPLHSSPSVWPSPGYSWKAGQSKQVVYQASDGHIHELYVIKGGPWQHADLTAIAGAPSLGAPVVFHGYSWEAGQSKQVVYI
jgi:hypothetical protein